MRRLRVDSTFKVFCWGRMLLVIEVSMADPGHGILALFSALRRHESKSARSCLCSAPAASAKARTAISTAIPSGRESPCCGISSAIRCRRRRVVRCLTTALPTAFETINPHRQLGDAGRSCNRAVTTTVLLPARRPWRITAAKSPEEVSRCGAGSMDLRYLHRHDKGPPADA